MELWKSWWRNCSVLITKAVRQLALFLIAVYRTTLSGFVGGGCRFDPSCSHYAQIAFENHPPFYAFALTLRRLFKCHPFGPYGLDPVPESRGKYFAK